MSKHQFIKKELWVSSAEHGQSPLKLQLYKTGVSLLLSQFCSQISISIVLFVLLIVWFQLLYRIVFFQCKPTPTFCAAVGFCS